MICAGAELEADANDIVTDPPESSPLARGRLLL